MGHYTNLLIFFGDDNDGQGTLWTEDGTGSTARVAPVGLPGTETIPGAASTGLNLDAGDELGVPGPVLFSYGGMIYMAGADDNGSVGLWVSQGTGASTKEIVGAWGENSFGVDPQDFVAYDGEVYFNGLVSEGLLTGQELFVTNGTSAGTLQLSDSALAPSSLAVYDGLLYFNGAGGNEIGRASCRERVWR